GPVRVPSPSIRIPPQRPKPPGSSAFHACRTRGGGMYGLTVSRGPIGRLRTPSNRGFYPNSLTLRSLRQPPNRIAHRCERGFPPPRPVSPERPGFARLEDGATRGAPRPPNGVCHGSYANGLDR